MAFWAAAQLQPQRDQLALHCLNLFGFETYAPRLRDQRTIRGRKVIKTPLLFPAYRTAMQSGTMVAGCRPPGHGRDHAGRRPRHGGHLVQGAGSERPDRVATSTSAISGAGITCVFGASPVRQPSRTVRRNAAARTGGGAAEAAGRYTSGRFAGCDRRTVAMTLEVYPGCTVILPTSRLGPKYGPKSRFLIFCAVGLFVRNRPYLFGFALEFFGGRTRARTWDPMIKSSFQCLWRGLGKA